LTSCYCRSLLLLVCLIFVLVVGSSSGGHGLEHHLAVLNEIVGVTGAKDFGTEGDRDKQFGVYLSLRTAPGRDGVSRIRVPCTAVIETKLDAALVARQKVAAALGPAGPAACEAAEQRVLAKLHGAGDASADASTAAAPTEEELEWLASWFRRAPKSRSSQSLHLLTQRCDGGLTETWMQRPAGIAQAHRVSGEYTYTALHLRVQFEYTYVRR
jgi:hypothetical protein